LCSVRNGWIVGGVAHGDKLKTPHSLTSERRPCLPGSDEASPHHRVTAISLDAASTLGWETIPPSCVPIADTPLLVSECDGIRTHKRAYIQR
jgi:hypothetical protein